MRRKRTITVNETATIFAVKLGSCRAVRWCSRCGSETVWLDPSEVPDLLEMNERIHIVDGRVCYKSLINAGLEALKEKCHEESQASTDPTH